MIPSSFLSFIFIILGIFQIVRPDILIRFWFWARYDFIKYPHGEPYIPIKHSSIMVRILGVLFVSIGVLTITK